MRTTVCYLYICSSFKKSHANKLYIGGYIFALPEVKYSYFMIQKGYIMHSIKIPKCKISNIINREGKNLQCMLVH